MQIVKKRTFFICFIAVLIIGFISLTILCLKNTKPQTLSEQYIEDLQSKCYYLELINITFPNIPASFIEARDGDNYKQIWQNKCALIKGEYYYAYRTVENEEKICFRTLKENQPDDITWLVSNCDFTKLEFLGSGYDSIEWPENSISEYYYEDYGYSIKTLHDTDEVSLDLSESDYIYLRFYYNNDELYAILNSSTGNTYYIKEWSDSIPDNILFEIPEEYTISDISD